VFYLQYSLFSDLRIAIISKETLFLITYFTCGKSINAFLRFNNREILGDPGKVSAELAKEFAESEFKKYRVTQDKLFESDFDKLVKKTKNLE
jgi:hypothetical protein